MSGKAGPNFWHINFRNEAEGVALPTRKSLRGQATRNQEQVQDEPQTQNQQGQGQDQSQDDDAVYAYLRPFEPYIGESGIQALPMKVIIRCRGEEMHKEVRLRLDEVKPIVLAKPTCEVKPVVDGIKCDNEKLQLEAADITRFGELLHTLITQAGDATTTLADDAVVVIYATVPGSQAEQDPFTDAVEGYVTKNTKHGQFCRLLTRNKTIQRRSGSASDSTVDHSFQCQWSSLTSMEADQLESLLKKELAEKKLAEKKTDKMHVVVRLVDDCICTGVASQAAMSRVTALLEETAELFRESLSPIALTWTIQVLVFAAIDPAWAIARRLQIVSIGVRGKDR